MRKAIAELLDVEGYDDGSYGPVLVRLAWHASGTYDKATNSGGSNGATMRFSPESDHGANAGLKVARDLLEKVKQKFPWISYADLWTLGGAVAVEEMGGPHVPWRPGRADAVAATACPPDGRLPNASKGAQHLRDIFYRMVRQAFTIIITIIILKAPMDRPAATRRRGAFASPSLTAQQDK